MKQTKMSSQTDKEKDEDKDIDTGTNKVTDTYNCSPCQMFDALHETHEDKQPCKQQRQ